MAKYSELNKKDKVYFWIGAVFAILLLAGAGYLIYRFAYHLFYHEWIEAYSMAAGFFAALFWGKNRRNKKKVKELEAEVLLLKTTKAQDLAKAFQSGIDFQRSMLAEWIGQRIARNG